MKRASLKESEAARRRNLIERLKFIDAYVEWLQKTPNKVWSRQLAKMLDG